jgi:hypothetical protein
MYAQPAETTHTIGSLFAGYAMPQPKKQVSERGELLEYFCKKLSIKIPMLMGRWLWPGITLQDLYFIKSSCDQAEQRGIAWGAAFYTSVKVPE